MTKEIRFAVGNGERVVSSVWRLWAHKNNLYLAARSLAGTAKVSFHESGICRFALVSKTPREALHRWTKGDRTVEGTTPLFSIVVPALSVPNHYQDTIPPRRKAIRFLDTPLAGTKLIVLLFTTELDITEADLRKLPHSAPLFFIGRLQLGREAVWLVTYYQEMPPDEQHRMEKQIGSLRINMEHGSATDYVTAAMFHSLELTDPPCLFDLPVGPGNVYIDEELPPPSNGGP